MPPGADPPGRDQPEIRYATPQAVTEAGPAGAGLRYGARRGGYYARGRSSRLTAPAVLLGAAGGRRPAAGPHGAAQVMAATV
jgi:hypothetical protein